MSAPLLEQIYEAGVKDERKKWEERIEQMIAEIDELSWFTQGYSEDTLIKYVDVLDIIKKYTKEQVDNTRPYYANEWL